MHGPDSQQSQWYSDIYSDINVGQRNGSCVGLFGIIPIESSDCDQSDIVEVQEDLDRMAIDVSEEIQSPKSPGEPEELSVQFYRSRARAESASNSNDVNKFKVSREVLHPQVLAELREKGALYLPPKAKCDELIDAFFQWAAPLVPVVNKQEFMRLYQDPSSQPPLLLLQAVLAAGSTVSGATTLLESKYAAAPVAETYFDRARLLYEANHETDSVTVVQALILMGWYWEALDETTKDSFYWTKVSINAAQVLGMNRIFEASCLDLQQKRLRKRIWWTLLTRDCSVTAVLGGSLSIDMKRSNITMIRAQDFQEDDDNSIIDNPPNLDHVLFFLQYAELSQHTALVLSHLSHFIMGTKSQVELDSISGACGMSLAAWLRDCPTQLRWEADRHEFWPAVLHSNYYTTICLLHRAQMYSKVRYREAAYNSGQIAFRAAGMITSIVKALADHDELCRCPGIMVYNLFSALTIHIFHMKSPDPKMAITSNERFSACMNALEIASRTWRIACAIHSMFRLVVGKPELEQKLQQVAEHQFSN